MTLTAGLAGPPPGATQHPVLRSVLENVWLFDCQEAEEFVYCGAMVCAPKIEERWTLFLSPDCDREVFVLLPENVLGHGLPGKAYNLALPRRDVP